MGFTPDHRGTSLNHEINMVPLIDVSLVLVVMLLLATPLAFESSIDVRGAAQAARHAKVEKAEPRIEVALVSEDSVRVNRKIIPRSELAAALRPLIVASEKRSVAVTCAPAVTHGAFVDVLDQAKICGAIEIAVVQR